MLRYSRLFLLRMPISEIKSLRENVKLGNSSLETVDYQIDLAPARHIADRILAQMGGSSEKILIRKR